MTRANSEILIKRRGQCKGCSKEFYSKSGRQRYCVDCKFVVIQTSRGYRPKFNTKE